MGDQRIKGYMSNDKALVYSTWHVTEEAYFVLQLKRSLLWECEEKNHLWALSREYGGLEHVTNTSWYEIWKPTSCTSLLWAGHGSGLCTSNL